MLRFNSESRIWFGSASRDETHDSNVLI